MDMEKVDNLINQLQKFWKRLKGNNPPPAVSEFP